MKVSEKKLRRVLGVNGLFSLSSGAILILSSDGMASLMGVSLPQILWWIGLCLLVFASTVLFEAFRKKVKRGKVKLIIYQDWGWVLGSAILLIGGWVEFSLPGYILVIAVAFVVAGFALLQRSFLRAM